MKYVWIFIAAIALVDAVAFVVFVGAPKDGAVRSYFVSEDNLIENLTASVYLFTFLFAFVLLRIRSMKDARSRKFFILFSVFGLIGCLEEISYGERFFDINMPTLGGVKIDAIHDFFGLGINLILSLATNNQVLILLVFLSGLVLSIIAIRKYGKRYWDAAIVRQYYPSILVTLLFIVLIFSSLMLDTDRFHFRGYKALEEFLELNAAVALLTSCFLIYKLETDKPPSS